MYNLQDKKFKAIANTDNGEVNEETIFHYRQKGDIVWATYEGGAVKFGTLSGSIKNDTLEFTYQHQNHQQAFMTGQCITKIKSIDGKITLHESWQWTSGDKSKGTSVLSEL